MLRCIAVDDEPLALSQIKKYAERIPELELLDVCLSTKKAAEILAKEDVDLVLLDVEMPSGNGMDFAASLQRHRPEIIFITAYSKYAVDGFRVEAIDYLLKPLSFSEFERAISKVLKLNRIKERSKASSETIFVRSEGETHSINVEDIVYIKSMGEYAQITIDGISKPLTTLQSLKHFVEVLPTDRFMRVHKSFIINLGYIKKADARAVTVRASEIPIGDKYRKTLREYLNR